MKIKLIIALLLTSSFIFAQKTTEIKGRVLNNTNFEKIYLENIATETVIDSSKLASDGSYNFKLKIEKSSFYKISLDENNFSMYIPEVGEKANITLDIQNPSLPQIKGSKHTSLIYDNLIKSNKIDEKLDSYKLQLEEEKKELVRKMIKENSSSLSCMFFIGQLEIESDIETYKTFSKGLKKYSDIGWIAEIIKKTENANKLGIGTPAPEIELISPEGKLIKLSSFKGKYVLIDFWASWCRPCRAESPNLVRIYNKFKSKGFEIYSVSLDKEKDAWTDAIASDKLAWTHVTDLKYWDSAAGKTYGVSSIPFTVLIDKEGNIIAKGLRANELEEKLNEILK